MHLTRLQQVILLGGVFLLAMPVAQAKKPGGDDAYRDERSQSTGRQTRDNSYRDTGRDADTGATRIERRSNSRDYQQPRYDQPRYDRDTRPQPGGKSLSEAVSEAEQRTGGRVLSADPREENGQLYYRVKVLTPNGRVQILYIDAR